MAVPRLLLIPTTLRPEATAIRGIKGVVSDMHSEVVWILTPAAVVAVAMRKPPKGMHFNAM